MQNININPLHELESHIYHSLETYSNVHRGSGYNSRRTTELYEQAGKTVLDYLGLSSKSYLVIFCSPVAADAFVTNLKPGTYQLLSSADAGLSMGVRALVMKKSNLPEGAPVFTGGGTTRLISRNWVVWSGPPARFEPGTPAVVNVIAFVKALELIKKHGTDIFNPGRATETFPAISLIQDEFAGLKGHEMLARLRRTVIGKDIRVSSDHGNVKYVNLDNAASTRTFEPVWEVYRRCLITEPGSRREIVENSRNILAQFFDAPPTAYDIVFTSNTTEALNLAGISLSEEPTGDIEPVVLNTILEHNSNELPWRFAKGAHLTRLEVDNLGFIDLKKLESVLYSYNEAGEQGKRRIRIVAICGASNVLGTCNDLEAIAQIAHRYGARLLVDGAQLAAHRPVSLSGAGIDFFAFSGHKTYAPFGSGALIARKGQLHFSDEEMQRIRKNGEENVAGIAALGKALHLLNRIGMEIIQEDELGLTSKLLNEMNQVPGIRIYGIKDPGHPLFREKVAVVAFDFKNMIAHTIAKRLSEKGGIGIRSGCHCAHMIVKHILGVKPPFEGIQRLIVKAAPKLQLPGVARVSLGIENSEEDIDRLVEAVREIAAKR